MRSRGARGMRGLVDLDLGPVDLARAALARRTVGRVAWKSKNSSGSIVAKRVASSAAPTNGSAAEAASPASFQPLNAQTSAGARRPSGRLSQRRGCIRVHGSGSRPALWPSSAGGRRSPRCAPGEEVDGVFACTRKDRLLARTGHAVPRARAARPHGRDARRARSATPTCSPGASSAATSCACAGASSASATSCRSSVAAIAARRATPTRPRSCPSPTATSTSSTASSSTSRARSTTPATRRCSTRCSATSALRAALAPRAVHARRPPRLPRRAARAHGRGRRRSRSRRARCTRG